MKDIINSLAKNHTCTKEELINLLSNSDIDDYLFSIADKIREQFIGNEVHLRGLIEFSNICKRNCMYCGLRRENKKIKRYRLNEEEIIALGKKAKNYGYQTLVLQSGEDDYFTTEKLTYILKELKKLDVAITLSIGERSFNEYKELKDAGADRFLIRIETTDKNLYEKLDPGMSHDERKRCLNDLKTLGYEVGTGALVGLPNQSIESLAEDLLFFKSINADMVGIGPFISNSDTPLKDCPNGDFNLALKMMALTRLLLPTANIPATTAMETLNKNGRIIALQSGANVVMPNVTEGEYRKLYALYPGKICTGDTPAHCVNCITGKIKSIGREISKTKGFRKKPSY